MSHETTVLVAGMRCAVLHPMEASAQHVKSGFVREGAPRLLDDDTWGIRAS